MNKVMLTLAMIAASTSAFAGQSNKTDKQAKDSKIVCEKTETVQKVLHENGYYSLVNMKNSDGITETIWIGGQAATITATVPDTGSTCILAFMTDTVFNSDTLQGLYKAWDQQETKKKGI